MIKFVFTLRPRRAPRVTTRWQYIHGDEAVLSLLDRLGFELCVCSGPPPGPTGPFSLQTVQKRSQTVLKRTTVI